MDRDESQAVIVRGLFQWLRIEKMTGNKERKEGESLKSKERREEKEDS